MNPPGWDLARRYAPSPARARRGYRDPMSASLPIHPSLSPDALIAAYSQGWFPMDEPGASGSVGLFEANPRSVIPIDGFRTPRSVRRRLATAGFETRVDTAFAEVAAACGGDRDGEWLTPRLAAAYLRLHLAGYAHSVEIWRDDQLCGGLFGVALGGLFSSETMFHRESDAGNAALVAAAGLLSRAGYVLWDIQVASEHTVRFGAVALSPPEYRRRLREALQVEPRRFEVSEL